MKVWLAFFARHSPVSTAAKPACMNITRYPVINVQTILIAIRFWPTVLTTSVSGRPALLSLTGMSLTVPVIVPPGSPFAWSAADGPLIFLISAVVIGLGGAEEDDAATGEGACARASELGNSHAPASSTATSRVSWWRARLIRLNMSNSPSSFPDGLFEVSAVDDRQG